jgi:hypothetical protein
LWVDFPGLTSYRASYSHPAQLFPAVVPGPLQARNAGLGTADAPRPGEWGEHDDRDLSTDEAFDVIARGFPDLATQLGT